MRNHNRGIEYQKRKRYGNWIAFGGFFGGLSVCFILGLEGKIVHDWFLGLMIAFLIILGLADFL